MTGQIKIIAGQYKGRSILVPKSLDCRPTPNRVRESVFNILQFDIRGATCLDAFAGSGALGLEAYSRGAKKVVFLETAPAVYKHLKKTLAQFSPGTNDSHLELLSVSCLDFLKTNTSCFDIIFLDPPFRQDLWQSATDLIYQHKRIQADGILYIEAPHPIELDAEKWHLFKQNKMGMVYYHFFRPCFKLDKPIDN